MTALATDRKNTLVATTADRYRVGKVAGSVVIYKGAAICRNASGYLVPAANTAGYRFVGIAQEKVDTTGIADGVSECKYLTAVSVKMKNDGTAAVAQVNLGGPVWIQDDQTVRGTPGNGVCMGIAESIELDGEVVVFACPEAGDIGVDLITLAYDHAAATADTTVKLYKVPAGKKFVLIGADYINPTGLAQDAANYFDIKVIKDATVMANWSTLTGAQGTIAADTFVALVNSATAADIVAAAAAIIALFLDETGTATLPAGRIVIRGLLITT